MVLLSMHGAIDATHTQSPGRGQQLLLLSLRPQELTGCGSLSGALSFSVESGRPRIQAWDSYLQLAPPSI